MTRLFLVVALVTLLSARTAHAEHERSETVSRLSLAANYGAFANYPGAIGDMGPGLSADKPLWLGTRHAHIQWQLTASGLLGAGTNSRSAYLVAGPQVGFNVFLGSVLGLEMRMGLAAIAQAGSDSAFGFGMSSGGGYTFRFWKDDRKRIKLGVNMVTGLFLADDPGNDLATNAGAMLLNLGYEAPF